ncbi:MAG: hypothetical protein J0L69_00355 [Bacteroidetes bacterium]|nr:hypothetical protein [Bacteroidota bacterium]
MKTLYYILILFCVGTFVKGQDKVVFKNGKKLNCKIVSINPSTVTYKDSTSAGNMITVSKNEILMAEFSSGNVYIFGTTTNTSVAAPSSSSNKPLDRKAQIREKEKEFKDNIIGIQIPDVVFGRLTLTYERLFFDKQIGITLPVSMSYDRRVMFLGFSSDTSANTSASTVRRNVNFITGLDLNYYFESKSHTKFFIGPRFRYGTDVTMENITAYSVQMQNGILIASRNGKMASTLALGFGFVRIVASPFGGGINPKQSYPWGSFTFRLGFRA